MPTSSAKARTATSGPNLRVSTRSRRSIAAADNSANARAHGETTATTPTHKDGAPAAVAQGTQDIQCLAGHSTAIQASPYILVRDAG
eukprot:1683654-Pyramimonas_sp.AAC.1